MLAASLKAVINYSALDENRDVDLEHAGSLQKVQ